MKQGTEIVAFAQALHAVGVAQCSLHPDGNLRSIAFFDPQLQASALLHKKAIDVLERDPNDVLNEIKRVQEDTELSDEERTAKLESLNEAANMYDAS